MRFFALVAAAFAVRMTEPQEANEVDLFEEGDENLAQLDELPDSDDDDDLLEESTDLSDDDENGGSSDTGDDTSDEISAEKKKKNKKDKAAR